jgi:hypothetical protein
MISENGKARGDGLLRAGLPGFGSLIYFEMFLNGWHLHNAGVPLQGTIGSLIEWYR